MKIANGEIKSLALTGDDRRIFLASRENIKGLKVHLDEATREYANAKRIAKNADLSEVARFYNRYAQKGIKAIKVPKLIEKLLADLEADGRSDYHIRDLEVRLGRFAATFTGQIGDITSPQIDAWLRGLRNLSRTKKVQPISGTTRNNYLTAPGRPPPTGVQKIYKLSPCPKSKKTLPRLIRAEIQPAGDADRIKPLQGIAGKFGVSAAAGKRQNLAEFFVGAVIHACPMQRRVTAVCERPWALPSNT